ncbi:M42 family metallopeptidase [Alkalihalobacillus sp. LMS39]|uniref:M42 family metallopeptidase n=1 Tax=Alkalihalobacillus sp. LMS39 TaxID=2924032 RepID=UPI001FB1E49F|nr:M42 family metallopeptidase [Alkalihalobacillus sp. LMS39]UOE95731.1 M42 family metallopeptidase [Alkalihalobacillus sp. LMS39]
MNQQPNVNKMIEILEEIVNIPSPSGNTDNVITAVETLLQPYGVTMFRNHKGGLLISIRGEIESQHRMLTAHVDTLGAMVKEIKDDGRLRLAMIGGFRWNAVEGEYCEIETSNGTIHTGTILIHQSSVHVYKEAGSAKRDETNIEVRVDEQVKSKEDVKNLGIQVGDFVSFAPRFETTKSGFIKSRHLDDKASVAILLELIMTAIEEKWTLPYTTHFLISNNEEIGYGGNSNIPSEVVEYLAVDMGAIGDGQTTTEYCVSICAKDASGPYHKQFKQKLVDLAEEHSLNYEIDIYPYYGSDASAAIRSGHDIKHALIGPGIDASHAHERTHQSSLENTSKLLYAYVKSELLP